MYVQAGRGEDLSRRKNGRRKSNITLTAIDSSTDVKATANLPLSYAMSTLSYDMHQIEIWINRLLFRKIFCWEWEINSSKVMKQSCNHRCRHCSWWAQSSFCNLRFAPSSNPFGVLLIKCNWREGWNRSQCFWSQRKPACLNLKLRFAEKSSSDEISC